MKKKNTYKNKFIISILIKLLLPTLSIIALIAITLSVTTYKLQKKNLIQDAYDTTKLVAHVASNKIDSSKFTNVRTKDDVTSSSYASIFNTLSYINSNEIVSNIYTLYFNNGEIYYGIDTDKDITERLMPGELYVTNTPNAYELLSKGTTITSKSTIKRKNKNVLYSIAPVKNANGVIVGAIGCDYDVKYIYSALEKTTKKLTSITIVAVILTSIIIVFIIYRIIEQINKINNKMVTIVNNEGDLTQQLDIHSNDTLGSISQNTNLFMKTIRNLMIKIQKSASKINKLTKNSYDNMQMSSEHINNSETSLATINSSMETVINSCEIIASTSSIILNTVNNINSLINKGVSNAINIKNYAKDTNETHTNAYKEAQNKANILINNLKQQLNNAKQIQKIANLTNDIIEITDQTNTLALNANIEAAKSGDVGKSFSIVAEEISKLANTTENSANEIQIVTDTVINSVNELTTYAEKILTFLNNILFKGFEELVSNSTEYTNNSNQLSHVLSSFAESTSSFTTNIEEVQSSLLEVIQLITTNAQNIDDITINSKTITDKISSLYIQINEIKQAGAELNNEVNRFIV